MALWLLGSSFSHASAVPACCGVLRVASGGPGELATVFCGRGVVGVEPLHVRKRASPKPASPPFSAAPSLPSTPPKLGIMQLGQQHRAAALPAHRRGAIAGTRRTVAAGGPYRANCRERYSPDLTPAKHAAPLPGRIVAQASAASLWPSPASGCAVGSRGRGALERAPPTGRDHRAAETQGAAPRVPPGSTLHLGHV